jgi:hypothetical protein
MRTDARRPPFHDHDRSPTMKLRPLLSRTARLALVALAAGTLLSGCAAARPNGPGDCVGPPDFCVPFFGS